MDIRNIKINSRNTFLLLCFCAFVIVLIFFGFKNHIGVKRVAAQPPPTSYNVSGWLWSDTIGWVSLNCDNTNSCGDSDFGVIIDDDGNMSGWGWASTIGWLKFGGVIDTDGDGFADVTPPSGAGTVPEDAQLTGSDLTGWARFCGGTVSVTDLYLSDPTNNPYPILAGDCSTTVERPDGWEGWVALSGIAQDASQYGVSLSGSQLTGLVWGDTNVGWIDFSNVTYDAGASALNLGAQPPVVTEDNPDSTLTWSSANLDDTIDCVLSDDQGNSLDSALDTSGSYAVTVVQDTRYDILCYTLGGSPIIASADVIIGDVEPPPPPDLPEIFLSAIPQTAPYPGIGLDYETTLEWWSPDSSLLGSCTKTGGSNWAGPLDPNTISDDPASPSSQSGVLVALSPTVFTINCTNLISPVSVTVPQEIPVPSVDLKVEGVDGPIDLINPPFGTSVTLSWITDGIDSCNTYSYSVLSGDDAYAFSNPPLNDGWGTGFLLGSSDLPSGFKEAGSIVSPSLFVLECSNSGVEVDFVEVWVNGESLTVPSLCGIPQPPSWCTYIPVLPDEEGPVRPKFIEF